MSKLLPMPIKISARWKFWRHRLFWDFSAITCIVGIAFAAGFAPSVEIPSDDPNRKPNQRPSVWLIFFTAGAGVFSAGSRVRDWLDKRAESAATRIEKDARRIADDYAQKELEQAKEALKRATQRMVTWVLDTARREFFTNGEEDSVHKLRATLFRCVADDDPASDQKWLAVYARSGPNHDTSRRWEVVEENPEACRGVASYIWCIGATKIILPSAHWRADAPVEQRRAYAEATFLSVEDVESLEWKPTGFGGTVVAVGGEPWGVLLLDASERERLKETKGNSNAHTRLMERYAGLLGRMLKEGET